MLNIIKNSFIYKIIYAIINSYNKSKSKIFFDKIKYITKNSKASIGINKYLDKKPYFLDSIAYKVFRKFIKIIDKLMDFINKIFTKIIKNSNTYEELEKIRSHSTSKKLSLMAVLIIALNLGYAIGDLIFSNGNKKIMILMLIVSLMLVMLNKNENCYKNSILYKIFKSW